MVKKDEDEKQKRNSGKVVSNGRANNGEADAVGSVETSSAAASPQGSA